MTTNTTQTSNEYHTEFNVQYKKIEQELLEKHKDTAPEYTVEDIYEICDELYRHELLSVFGALCITDTKIDQVWSNLMPKLKSCPKFSDIFGIFGEGEGDSDEPQGGGYLIIQLFSYHVFYEWHECLCQFINTGDVDDQKIQAVVSLLTRCNK